MASNTEVPHEYFPTVDTHLLASDFVRQTFQIQVMQPLLKRGEDVRFPVVYATDANSTFDVLKGISYSLQRSKFLAPRFILVGIGYPGTSPDAGAVLRGRDMTFPGYPRFSTTPPPVEGVLVAAEGTKDFYGAVDFQHFIANELIPTIDRHYPTVPGDRTYFGHSMGGGFGLFTLFHYSSLFKSYIISSPGLGFHGTTSAGMRYENCDFVLDHAERFITSGATLDGARLYLSVGADEELETAYAQWRLTSRFYRLASRLKAATIPGLALTTEVFPGETHNSVWPLSFMHGIRAVYGAHVQPSL